MPSQKITNIGSRPITQIPAATFDTGAASTALGLANMFDGIAEGFAAQEDRVAVAKAKSAGALAGSKGAFARQDETTLVGEAFNAAALHTFSKTTDAKILTKHAELETTHRGNVLDFNDAMTAYRTGVLKEVEGVEPSLVPVLNASMALRQRQGAARIVKTMRSAMKDRATASTLTLARGIQERISVEAAQLDLGDIEEMTAFVGTLAQSRAQLNLAFSGLGPTGVRLFSEEARTAALLEFDDLATTTVALAGFNAALAAEQSGETGGVTPLALLNEFRAGNDVTFTVAGDKGEETTHRITIRDELRDKIATRMQSSMKAARAETTFKRATEDRARTTLQTSANANLQLGVSRGEANENDVEEQHAAGNISDRQRADRLIQLDARNRAVVKRQAATAKVQATQDAADIKQKRGDANANLDFAIDADDMDANGVNAAHKAGLLTDAQRTARLKQVKTRDDADARGAITDAKTALTGTQKDANANLDLAIAQNDMDERGVEAAHKSGAITDSQRTARIKQINARDEAAGKATKAAAKATAAASAKILTGSRKDANANLELAIAENNMDARGVDAAHTAGLLSDSQRTARLKQIQTRDAAIARGKITEAKAAATATAKAVTASQKDADARLKLAIDRGQIDAGVVEAMFQNDMISETMHTARLLQIDKRDDDEVDRAREAARAIGSQGRLDQNNPDDVKAVDAAFEAVIAPAIAEGDPDAAVPTIVDFVKKTGIVPRAVKTMIHGALRQGPAGDAENAEEIDANKLQAADMMGRLRDAVPTVMNEFTADEKNFGIHIQTLIEAGVPKDQAVRRAEEMRDVPPAVKEFRAKQVTTDDHFELNADFVDGEFEDDGTFFGADDTLAGAAFRAEFNEMQGRNFMRTGDLEASQVTAAADIRRVWASSAVGNAGDDEPRMMKYAPERYGPFPRAADNTDWLQNQFEQDMNALGKSIGMTETAEAEGAALAVAGAALGETTTATTPRSVADQFMIEADMTTAREVGPNGQMPTYFLRVLKNGAWVEARDADGDLARWEPDWSESDEKAQADAETAEALADANLARERNTAINADVRRTMDQIKGLAANPTQTGRELELPVGIR